MIKNENQLKQGHQMKQNSAVSSEISQKIGDATLFFEVTEIKVNPIFKPSEFE